MDGQHEYDSFVRIDWMTCPSDVFFVWFVFCCCDDFWMMMTCDYHCIVIHDSIILGDVLFIDLFNNW